MIPRASCLVPPRMLLPDSSRETTRFAGSVYIYELHDREFSVQASRPLELAIYGVLRTAQHTLLRSSTNTNNAPSLARQDGSFRTETTRRMSYAWAATTPVKDEPWGGFTFNPVARIHHIIRLLEGGKVIAGMVGIALSALLVTKKVEGLLFTLCILILAFVSQKPHSPIPFRNTT